MVRSISAPIAFGFVGLALALPPAHAQGQWNTPGIPLQKQTAMVWREMDLCAQQAAQKFPDHTPNGNAQREANRLECLRLNHLPVTTDPGRY
jgi:hypothetical protein